MARISGVSFVNSELQWLGGGSRDLPLTSPVILRVPRGSGTGARFCLQRSLSSDSRVTLETEPRRDSGCQSGRAATRTGTWRQSEAIGARRLQQSAAACQSRQVEEGKKER